MIFKNRLLGLQPVLSLKLLSLSGSKFPNESVAVMRWAICDLLSIETESYQIIEAHLISANEFSFAFLSLYGS